MSNSYFPSSKIDVESRARKALERMTSLPDIDELTFSGYQDRLSRELDYIRNAGLGDYIGAVTELVDHARSVGITVGPGRGSAPGSLVLYLLGVTRIDPIAHGLIAERWFSNPVIELDVEWHRRGELLDYLWKRYGEEHTSYISTYRRVKATGQLLSRGIHAACFAISSQPIETAMPTWRAKDGSMVIDGERHTVEEIGIGVITILGMKQLSVVGEATRRIRSTEPDFGLENVPEDDAPTMRTFQSADTGEIFLFSSGAMRQQLLRARPQCLEDLVALHAVFRPPLITTGTMEEFVRRMGSRPDGQSLMDRNGLEVGQSGMGVIDSVLADTLNMVLYQEQVIQMVHRLTGWSLLEAELYRRRAKQRGEEQGFQNELLDEARTQIGLSQK